MHALKISELHFKEGEVYAERITSQQNNMKKIPIPTILLVSIQNTSSIIQPPFS